MAPSSPVKRYAQGDCTETQPHSPASKNALPAHTWRSPTGPLTPTARPPAPTGSTTGPSSVSPPAPATPSSRSSAATTNVWPLALEPPTLPTRQTALASSVALPPHMPTPAQGSAWTLAPTPCTSCRSVTSQRPLESGAASPDARACSTATLSPRDAPVSLCTVPTDTTLTTTLTCASQVTVPHSLDCTLATKVAENSTRKCQSSCTTGFADRINRVCVSICSSDPEYFGNTATK